MENLTEALSWINLRFLLQGLQIIIFIKFVIYPLENDLTFLVNNHDLGQIPFPEPHAEDIHSCIALN